MDRLITGIIELRHARSAALVRLVKGLHGLV